MPMREPHIRPDFPLASRHESMRAVLVVAIHLWSETDEFCPSRALEKIPQQAEFGIVSIPFGLYPTQRVSPNVTQFADCSARAVHLPVLNGESRRKQIFL